MKTETTAYSRPTADPIAESEVLKLGREIIRTEAQALEQIACRMDSQFFRTVELLHGLRGNLIVTGMGKAGLIGKKLVATFASTGTRAHFLHPAEAFHGDLGRVHRGDMVLVLSQSGETGEVVQLLPSLRRLKIPLVAITASRNNTLGQAADVVLSLGNLDEACPLGLAPSTSTTVMLALGDALAFVVSQLQGFGAEDFARFHPGGSLGLKLSSVEEHMRPLTQCRTAHDDLTIRDVLVTCSKPGRRSGAIMLVDADGRLTGLFTDSDLARLIESNHDHILDKPIRQMMASKPATVTVGTKMGAAIELLAERKFSELPVVDAAGLPLGLIDVTDVVGLLPGSTAKPQSVDRDTSANIRIYPVDEAA